MSPRTSPLLLLSALLAALCLPPQHAHAFSIDSSINMANGTVLQALQARSGGAGAPAFDANWKDYDIILHLIAHAGFGPALQAAAGNGLTFFTGSDAALRQTARDLQEVHNLPATALSSERAVFDTLLDLLANRYDQPGAALTVFLRYHIVPARLSLPDVVGSGSFNTLAAQPIGRSGITLQPADPRFPWPQLTILPPSLHADNGNVHNIDRLLFPDMSTFALAAAGAAAATNTPAPTTGSASTAPPVTTTGGATTPPVSATDVSPDDGAGGASTAPATQRRPTATPSPSPAQAAAASPAPSVTPVPSVVPAVVPLQSASPFATPTPTQTPAPSRVPAAGKGAEGGDDEAQCFPARATVRTRAGRVALAGVTVGTEVATTRGWESVIAFSHAVHGGTFRFVELTVAKRNISGMEEDETVATLRATRGHFVPAGPRGRLVPAGAVVVGDLLRVADGALGRVVRVREVVDQGLFAPHTAGGDVVVDGVVASCYTTAVRPAAAHAWLAGVRALAAAGVRDPLRGVLDQGGDVVLRRWTRLSHMVTSTLPMLTRKEETLLLL